VKGAHRSGLDELTDWTLWADQVVTFQRGAHALQITGITWSSWGPYSAQGIGSETASNCIPDCATGAQITLAESLTLSQPDNGMFTVMTEQGTCAGACPGFNSSAPPTMWTYPSQWPIDAS
jgi:hypothetical protein